MARWNALAESVQVRPAAFGLPLLVVSSHARARSEVASKWSSLAQHDCPIDLHGASCGNETRHQRNPPAGLRRSPTPADQEGRPLPESGFGAVDCSEIELTIPVSIRTPLFQEPKVREVHKTLTAIMTILSVFLLARGYLCPAYHIGAMNEQQPGYQTVLSQPVAAVTGRNGFLPSCRWPASSSFQASPSAGLWAENCCPRFSRPHS